MIGKNLDHNITAGSRKRTRTFHAARHRFTAFEMLYDMTGNIDDMCFVWSTGIVLGDLPCEQLGGASGNSAATVAQMASISDNIRHRNRTSRIKPADRIEIVAATPHTELPDRHLPAGWRTRRP